MEVPRERGARADPDRPCPQRGGGRMRGGGILKELAKTTRAEPRTIRYPVEKVPIPEDFRARIAIRDELCFGCTICAVVCPTACIDMVPSVRGGEVKGKTIVRKR